MKKTKRFIVIVLDGFGVGFMNDVKDVRKEDLHSNTFASILKEFPDMKLKNLEFMGLMNIYGKESENMKFSESAVYGKSELMHYGADTFMGHQELMGTCPKRPYFQPFSEVIDEVDDYLKNNGHKVERKKSGGLEYLLVDDYAVVGDNIDTDLGMAYNCIAPLDDMPFEKELAIGKLVREKAVVNRVITFGGTGNDIDDIENVVEVKEGKFIGFKGARTKSYDQGYNCMHLGYGVNTKVQAPTILGENGVPVVLIGKVADIVENPKGKRISCVPTKKVMEITVEEIKNNEKGFICTNVQETDLAGHSQDAKKYYEILKIADDKIGEIINLLGEEDILVVTADHGNDPLIGHNRHTRENVPLLIYNKKIKGKNIGLRKSLSDIGASVCDYFNVKKTENGQSFLSEFEM